jgi:hypothetical protein
MIQLRKKIREIIKENILSESKKDISEIQDGYALIITRKPPIIDMILYDLNEDKIVGEISAYKYSKMKNFAVSTVAAERGFGSLMYEIMMTYVNPLGIMPSRDGDVREGAYQVYKRFFDLRKDIKKINLNPGDTDFSEEIADMLSDEDEEFYILQAVYFYSFGKEKLNSLIKNAKKLTPDKEKEIFDKANEYFTSKYD